MKEIFLLMGNDYVHNSHIGKISHKKRMNFEKKIDPTVIRKLYTFFAKNGIGRTCIVYAKNKKIILDFNIAFH